MLLREECRFRVRDFEADAKNWVSDLILVKRILLSHSVSTLQPFMCKHMQWFVLKTILYPLHVLTPCRCEHTFTLMNNLKLYNNNQFSLWHVYICSDFTFNSLRPRRNRRHFADDIFKCIFLNENVWIPIKISLKFVPKGPINNIPALVHIMAWRRPGDKPLSEPMMVSLLTHICVTRPQWVNSLFNSRQ